MRHLLRSRRFRQKEQAYIVEGDRWLDEIIAHGINPLLIFTSHEWLESNTNHDRVEFLGAPRKLVSDQIMIHMSDTESPPGIMAVMPMESHVIPESPTLLLILDRVANPGNLGAMLRTAAAAGTDGVILAPGCVDQHNPKVVRSSMGAILHLPIKRRHWSEIELDVAQMGVWVAATDGNTKHSHVDWLPPSVLIIGSESMGASSEARRLAKGVSISMAKGSESLNAAVAAGIILFEAKRQRAKKVDQDSSLM